ncbi:MAG TPA: GNAT family N-acetyltransferase, partial [Gaiellaceae bacterium]
TLLELAEEPGLWLPPEPKHDVVLGDGYCVVSYGRSVWVNRVRLTAEAVEQAVEDVRAIVRARGLDEVRWWAGERSQPADLSDRLRALGLADDDPAQLTTLATDSRPAGEPTVDVRRVQTAEDYLAALEIDWAAFDVDGAERAERRVAAREAWPVIVADGRQSTYLAELDGEPVGFGRAVFTPSAGLLLGGATLPAARGRGVYTSLVHARWRGAVERGVPRLVVAAGPMSAPILERLGFRRLGTVQLLRDRL